MASTMNMEKLTSAAVSIGVTAVVSCVLAYLATHVLEVYGSGLFVATPAVCGILSTWVYNRKGQKRMCDALSVALLTGLISLFGFLVVGLEGLICMVMAAPIVLPLFLTGGLIGYVLSHAIGKRLTSDVTVLMVVLSAPFLMGFNAANHGEPKVRKAVTSVVIKGSSERVWEEVIAFSSIPEPTSLCFRMGIAYPTQAHIEGRGVGATRYCQFSTGSFVEPITHWDEFRRLAFDVMEQPLPMTEISPYMDLHPPHLDWALRSVKGQFLLTDLGDGSVLLEGTTWFYVRMDPQVYWSWISAQIIHLIHQRVLGHIRNTVERDTD